MANKAIISAPSIDNTEHKLTNDLPMSNAKSNDKRSFNYIAKTFIAGGIAGCAAKTAVAPLDRVKILFQVSNPKVQQYSGSFRGIFSVMRQMYDLHGVRGLFQGHAATILRVYPYAAIRFMSFEQFKSVLDKPKILDRGTAHFVSGSLAGITSVFFTYPFDTLRTRMAYEIEDPKKLGQIARAIYTEPPATPKLIPILGKLSGLTNFYRGFVATLAGSVPYAGAGFWCHSFLTDWFHKNLAHTAVVEVSTSKGPKKKLKAWAELTCGGLAGAFGQTVSYPLEVVRRKMQVAGRQGISAELDAINDLGKRRGLIATAKAVYKTKGWRGFFVGLSIGYIKVTPMVAISFYTYASMKSLLDFD